jgi:Xylose isomerase-like TIM barrel.
MPQVYVATNAFGPEMVMDRGQLYCLEWIAGSGAAGIELRRELFCDEELSRIGEWGAPMKRHGLTLVYSAPVQLWAEDGTLNADELSLIFEEAAALDAAMIKTSLGHFQPKSDLGELEDFLKRTGENGKLPVLTVENDQTDWGGKLAPLERFFNQCDICRIPVKMTFDIANWHWVLEDPNRAAVKLAGHVAYIHVKQSVRSENGNITVPIKESADAEWRKILALLPGDVPRGIEFPIRGRELAELTRKYVQLLSNS